MADMMEAREILEIPAARLAAARRDEPHLTLLRTTLERGAQTHGREAMFREHRSFHRLIVAAAGNHLLSVMTEPVFKVLETRFVRPDIPARFWPEVDDGHAEILGHISGARPARRPTLCAGISPRCAASTTTPSEPGRDQLQAGARFSRHAR